MQVPSKLAVNRLRIGYSGSAHTTGDCFRAEVTDETDHRFEGTEVIGRIVVARRTGPITATSPECHHADSRREVEPPMALAVVHRGPGGRGRVSIRPFGKASALDVRSQSQVSELALPAGQIVKCATFDERPTAAGHKCYRGSPDSRTSASYGAHKLPGTAPTVLAIRRGGQTPEDSEGEPRANAGTDPSVRR